MGHHPGTGTGMGSGIGWIADHSTLVSPELNLEDAQMRPRHAARVQRPHGQIPEAIRPDTDGHTAESPRTRSRNSGRQLCNHGVRCRYRTVALWLSKTIAGRTLPVGSHEPTGPTNIHVVESPGGASHRAPAPANIHVTKSPGTLPPRRARRVRSVKIPRPSSMTAARRHIHTSKSLCGLLRRNPETHSRVQIAAVHAHEHDPAEHSIIQIPGVHATEHSPEEPSHCQTSAAESFRA